MATDPHEAESVSPQRCPKCGLRPSSPGPCHRCGLDLSTLPEGLEAQPWERVSDDKAPLAEELQRRWDALADDFLARDGHDEIIAYASVTGLVDLLARRYRFFVDEEPDGERRLRAEASLAQLVELMQAQFVAGRGQDEGELWERRARIIKGVLYVIVVLMCVGVIALTFVVVRPLG